MPTMMHEATSDAATRKRRQLSISLSLDDYAAFAALAAADKRKPGALARIAILEFLAQRKAAKSQTENGGN